MSNQTIATRCIVADRFSGFAVHDQVSTLSSFVGAVRRGDYDDVPGPVIIWAGQGIGEYEWEYIRAALSSRDVLDRLILQDRVPEIAGRAEAHKYRAENTLIADLTRVDEENYQAVLRLHSENELLLDHQTGQHVQGMVVVEAVRQMFLAVTERYYASKWPRQRYYYVIDSLATTFENFLFPLDAALIYEIRHAELGDNRRLRFGVRVDIEQGGRRSARSEIEFTAFAAEHLHEVEHRRADRALGHHRSASGVVSPAYSAASRG